MPLPTIESVHSDAFLTDFAQSHGSDLAKDFAADRAPTLVEVDKQSNKYAVWDKGDLFRNEMTLVAPGDKAPIAGQRMSEGTYFCDPYKLAVRVPDATAAQSDVDLEQAAVKYLMHQAKLNRESLFASAFLGTSIWSGVADASPANKWDNASSGTPLADIRSRKESLRTAIGRAPNTIVTSAKVADALRYHPDITDLYKHTQGGLVGDDLLAAALGVDNFYVSYASQNSANEGAATSMADIVSDNLLICYVSPSKSVAEPTSMAAFVFKEFANVGPNGAQIDKWYDVETESTMLRCKDFIDYKVIGADYGALSNDVLT